MVLTSFPSFCYQKLAAHWLKLSSAIEVTPSQRQQAKQLCYALIYGMGAQGLSSQLDITEGDAQNMIDSFLRAFPGKSNALEYLFACEISF